MNELKYKAILTIKRAYSYNNIKHSYLSTVQFDIKKHDIPYEYDYSHIENIFLRTHLKKALSLLSKKESSIVMFRYGLINKSPHTLEETGKEYGVSRERVRQIEAKALEKIRQSHYSSILRQFMP